MPKLIAFNKNKIANTVKAMLTCYAALPVIPNTYEYEVHTAIDNTYHKHYAVTQRIKVIKTLVESQMATYVWTK